MAETIEVPTEVLGEMAREQALLDCEMRVLAPEGAEDHFDKWTLLKEAELKDVEWEDDDLHVWFEDEARIQEMVARATHWQPAEYKNHYVPAYISIVWSMQPEEQPDVTIEVESP